MSGIINIRGKKFIIRKDKPPYNKRRAKVFLVRTEEDFVGEFKSAAEAKRYLEKYA